MRNNSFYKAIIVLLLVVIAARFIKSFLQQRNGNDQHSEKKIDPPKPSEKIKPADQNDPAVNKDIYQLTKEETVVSYVKQNKRLPEYYITKKAARKNGWDPSQGNLCEVLPGKAIGGDVFTNREGHLPEQDGRIWYEADLNYDCEHRNADRLLFSNDGLVFVTKDHYKTFVEK